MQHNTTQHSITQLNTIQLISSIKHFCVVKMINLYIIWIVYKLDNFMMALSSLVGKKCIFYANK